MSQHDLDIANQGFPATRADINNALQALGSSNSGATAPSTTYANQLWYDTANNILKIRNEDNDAWISLLYLDQTNDAVAQFDVDNIRIDGNTISSTDTNGDITLDPDGTGDTILASGNVGIGTSSPASEISGSATALHISDSNVASLRLDNPAGASFEIYSGVAGQLAFTDDATERMRIDSSGNVGIGTTTVNDQLVVNSSSAEEGITVRGGGFDALKIGLVNPGTSNDGVIGMKISNALRFIANDTERMRLTNDGHFIVGRDNKNFDQAGFHAYPNGEVNVVKSGVPFYINRLSSDGTLISLQQDTTPEGTISVSGTTVSYNGGHLSRWSQLTDGTKDTTIVKGTVLTNLDQMAVWSHDEVLWTADDDLPDGVSIGDVKTAAYIEDNEQLNCMAVSSVEGDANVAGVFVNWDYDDDDFNDMNVAMTGDMVIRIASGTTVARGDLLMSAGDGTAKPQGDDIVRSKTIAKVTSTTVSHTYDDGSYLVPCVLMAC